jgi:hypothetical protein
LSDTSNAAHRLRGRMTACRIHFTWLGLRRSLNPEQKARAADAFQASGRFLSAGKKLLDTGHPSVRKVTGVKSSIQKFWHGVTVPFPESGVRLIPQRRVEDFAATMTGYKQDLEDAVDKLQVVMPELKSAARARLGDLYADADYPERLDGLFAVEWDFPSVEPPAYLQDLSPEIYEEERRRVQKRFEEAVRLTEEAFTDEFGKLVNRLVERLGEPAPGEPRRVFRDSAVENLGEFFARFKELNVSNNDELDRLVEQVQNVVRGVEPQQLRDSAALRQRIAENLSQVQQSLDGMMVERPRRRILRSPAATAAVA